MNFLERIAAMSEVKQAEQVGNTDLTNHIARNDKLVQGSIVSKLNERPSFVANHIAVASSAEYVRFFMRQFDGTQELYVLTHNAEKAAGGVREAVPVSQGLPEVAAYAEAKRKGAADSELEKSRRLASASLVCAIGKIKDPVVGFTLDRAIADEFVHSLDPDKALTLDSDIEELSDVWRKLSELDCSVSSNRKEAFVKSLLGKDAELVPDFVMTALSVMTPPPFHSIEWYMALHQIKLGRPIDRLAFLAIRQSDVFQSCLGNGLKLEGLDLSKQAQIVAINYAIKNNKNMDELRDGDVWKSPEEMNSICDRWKSEPEMPTFGGGGGTYYGAAYDKERERRAEQDRLYEMRRQTNAIIDGQIAQLNAQLEATERDYRFQRISSSEYSIAYQSIQRQIKELERKKNGY